MIEAATRYSVGSGVYEQIDPNEQIVMVESFLGDLVAKGLVLGYLGGNHEERIRKETGIDVSRIICRELKIPYLGAAGWNLWYVGDESYTVYSIHGATGARFPHTKLKAAVDISAFVDADIVAHAHGHEVVIDAVIKERVNKGAKVVEQRKCHTIMTGHYLKYHGSYGQAKGFPPGKMGSPKAKLAANKHDVHMSD